MIELTGSALDLATVGRIAGGEACSLSQGAIDRMERSRGEVERAVAAQVPVYGINTGFGELATVSIPAGKAAELQRRLLLSHAAGVGRALEPAVVRVMLGLRANALAVGLSGIRPAVVERLLLFLERDWLPFVPRRGSVGASGDLAPLAHLALPLLGEGLFLGEEDRPVPAMEQLSRAGLEPLALEPKEGLALINGTQAMTAVTAVAALEAGRLVRLADLVGALSLEALRGSDTAFDPRLHAARPHPGQETSARNLRALLQGSEIRESHRENDPRVQDPYSLRCMPQVHGAVRDVLADVVRRLEIEFNAVTDNPLVFADGGEILSGGNFHGEPIAFAADFLGIALTELASISERRIEKMTDPHHSGLPPFLVTDAGLDSGFMIPQVTAAALVSELKGLAHPASVDSIPTSAGKEDHVSMGMTAALKLQRIVLHVRRVLAIETLAAAQGLEFHRPLRSSRALEAFYATVREIVEPWERDRWAHPDLVSMERRLGGDLSLHLDTLE